MRYEFRGATLRDAVSKAVSGHATRQAHNYELKGWSGERFLYHFYTGGGATVTLDQIGLLQDVQQEANRLSIDRSDGFKYQIRQEVRRVQDGTVRLSFDQSYHFGSVRWVMGGGKLAGDFNGQCVRMDKVSKFSGVIDVEYSDKFDDALNLVETLYGSSDSPRAPRWLRNLSNAGGRSFRIIGRWRENYQGEVNL